MAEVIMNAVFYQYGRRRVLNGADLAVGNGECAVLFGANGAGKSTLLALLATRYRLQKGNYQLNGHRAPADGEEIRRQLVLAGHHTQLYGHLTAMENARFFCDLRGLYPADAQLRQVIAEVGLHRFADQAVAGFSAGMRKRLALARVILTRPSLLLLDEPYSALDSEGVLWLNRVLNDYLQQGGTVVMASHDPDRIKALPHREYRLEQGRVNAAS